MLFPVFALLLAVACEDREEPTKAPTAPVTAVTAAESLAHAASTVCRSYTKELNAAKALQVQQPGDGGLQKKVTTLNEVIADACR